VVPGADDCVAEFEKARDIANEIGYPVIIKPSIGGGGIEMTIVANEGELAKALESTQAIGEKRRIAAIAVVAVLTQMHRDARPK
jgi:pyruvate carboxylase subunit A